MLRRRDVAGRAKFRGNRVSYRMPGESVQFFKTRAVQSLIGHGDRSSAKHFAMADAKAAQHALGKSPRSFNPLHT